MGIGGEKGRETLIGLMKEGIDMEKRGGVSGGGKLFRHDGCLFKR